MLTENQNNKEWEWTLQNKRRYNEFKEESPLNLQKMSFSEIFANETSVSHWEKMWHGTTSGELDDLLKICHSEISVNMPRKTVGESKDLHFIFIFLLFYHHPYNLVKINLEFHSSLWWATPLYPVIESSCKNLLNYENNKWIKNRLKVSESNEVPRTWE